MGSPVSLSGTNASTVASGGAVNWSNINGAYGVNTGTPATASITGSVETYQINVGGFATNQIPSGATIVGIEVGVQAWWSGTSSTPPSVVLLGYDINSKTGSDLAGASLSTSVGYSLVSGSSSTFPPGLSTVTAADINTGSITVEFQATGNSTTAGATVNMCAASVQVWYSTPPPVTPPQCVVVRAAWVPID